MNPIPPVDEQLLLDYVFDLLEPAEAARVEGYIQADAAWQAAYSEQSRFEQLLQVAVRGNFTEVSFTPPQEEPTPDAAKPTKPEPSPSPATSPDLGARAAYHVWARYISWACLFLGLCALGLPMLRDIGGFALYSPQVHHEYTSLKQLQVEEAQKLADLNAAKARLSEQVEQERARLDTIFQEWLQANRAERQLYQNASVLVNVKGPVAAQPGQPNTYTVQVAPKATGNPDASELTAEVKSSTGEVLYRAAIPNRTGEHPLTLPANIWNKLDANAGLTLEVLAKDRASGKLTPIRAPVNLFEPTFTTYLTTDRPLYRPGEKIYFRTLTLERSRFLPPEQDQTLQFELLDPKGKAIPGLQPIIGLARPSQGLSTVGPRTLSLDQQERLIYEPILGPDGQPIRGVASGMFQLPGDLPGGSYRLVVTEATASGFVPPNARPIAVKRLLIAGYNPDRLLKTLTLDASSYGPGDSALAQINIQDQVRGVSGAVLQPELNVDGQVTRLNPVKTDARGNATLSISLPTKPTLEKATLTVTVTVAGIVETIVRPLPIRTAKLKLEFFPEGGELVQGVLNRVYFRAATALGTPADVQAELFEGTTSLLKFQTLTDADHRGVNQGQGVFEFTPKPDQAYTVRLLSPKGVSQPEGGYPLPKVQASGVGLRVEAVEKPGQPLKLTLANQGANRTLIVGVYARGRPLTHERLTLEAGRRQPLSLNLGSAGGGVTRVTVFEELPGQDDLQPLAERLVYVPVSTALTLRVDGLNPPGKPYQPGDKVQLQVHASTEQQQPTGAILWASVVNQSVLTQANDRTERLLPTHFLLNGELDHGDSLEDADFLLTDHPKARQALDLLLGTQGWRKIRAVGPMNPNPMFDPTLAIRPPASPSLKIRTRPQLKTANDVYWPKYEAAALALDQLEKQAQAGEPIRAELDDYQQAVNRVNNQVNKLRQAGTDLWFFVRNLKAREAWFPLTLATTFGLALVFGTAWATTRRELRTRRSVRWACLGFLGLGGLSIFGVSLPHLISQDWTKSVPDVVQERELDRWGRPRAQQSYGSAFAPSLNAPKAQVDVQERNEPPAARGNGFLPAGGGNAPFQLGQAEDPPGLGAPGRVDPPAIFNPRQNRFINRPQWNAIGTNPAVGRLLLTLQTLTPEDSAAFQSVPRSGPLIVREFAYQGNVEAADPTARSQFLDTLVWQPVLVAKPGTPVNLNFHIGDSLNSFRLMIAGHTLDGRLGATTSLIEVRKPFAVEPKLPLEISSADKLTVPLVLMNAAQAGTVTLGYSLSHLKADPAKDFQAPLPPGSSRQLVRLEPTLPQGDAVFTVTGHTTTGYADRVDKTIRIVPDGFPFEGSKSEVLESQPNLTASLPAWLPGTLKVTVTLYPNTLSQIQSSRDGLLREPHGCFEQASSANYPNVLALHFMRQSGQQNLELANRSREYLERGYAKLIGYECPKTGSVDRIGFEWFGAADRPHEALTAYGLLQFTDMSRVYPVEPALLQRSKSFLMSRRDGQGGFLQSKAALDTFGKAPEALTNAYIVWAITESERISNNLSDLRKELEALKATTRQPSSTSDPYLLALVGLACWNAKDRLGAMELVAKLEKLQTANGSWLGTTTSITRSVGRDLAIETTALATLLLHRASLVEPTPQRKAKLAVALGWLMTQRGPNGTFGNTQATVLTLRTLLEANSSAARRIESGEVILQVGNQRVTAISHNTESPTATILEVADAEKLFQPGDNSVQLFSNMSQPIPMSVSWSGRTLQPRNSAEAPITIETKLMPETIEEGRSVRLNVTVKNQQPRSQGMVVAVVGLPAGLRLPDDKAELTQLTTSRNDGQEAALSYWEQNGRELVLYWRGMADKQVHKIDLTLIADVPGYYRGPASRAYLYYGSDTKHWAAPLSVTINAKP